MDWHQADLPKLFEQMHTYPIARNPDRLSIAARAPTLTLTATSPARTLAT